METITSDHSEEMELVKMAKENSLHFGELYDRYIDRIYNYVYKRVSHRETAEDLCAQTFTKALEKLPAFEFKGYSFGVWLYTIAGNTISDYFKSSVKRKNITMDEDVDFKSDSDVAGDVNIRIELETVQRAMNSLPAREQEILSLKFFSGMEPAEIALVTGLSANNVSVISFRGLKKLRKRLENTKRLALLIILSLLSAWAIKSIQN